MFLKLIMYLVHSKLWQSAYNTHNPHISDSETLLRITWKAKLNLLNWWIWICTSNKFLGGANAAGLGLYLENSCLKFTLCRRYYLHFIGKESEAQNSYVTCQVVTTYIGSKWQGAQDQAWNLNLGLFVFSFLFPYDFF